MRIKTVQSTLMFSLSVLLGTIPALTTVPARAAAQAEVQKGKTDSQKPTEASPASQDAVRIHIEIREWQLSPEELEAIESQENQDWVELATRKDARTRVMYVFDSGIRVGKINKKGKRIGSQMRFTSDVEMPYLTTPKSTNSGQTDTPIKYEKMGCDIDLFCQWSDEAKKNEIEAFLDIRFNDIISQTDKIAHPTFMRIKQRYTTVVALGEQQVFLRLMNPRLGKEDKVFAYLFIVRFDDMGKQGGKK